MKAVADTLGIARSNLADQAKRGGSRPRGPYRKPGDAEFLPILRRLVDERPRYGYRRLTALLNRKRRAAGEPLVNAKRVLRILRLLADAGAPITSRSAAATARSPAYCSRSTPAIARSSPRRGLLTATASRMDRAPAGARWSATTAGISGQMAQGLMVTCVERRFGSTRAASPVEWLTDNRL